MNIRTKNEDVPYFHFLSRCPMKSRHASSSSMDINYITSSGQSCRKCWKSEATPPRIILQKRRKNRMSYCGCGYKYTGTDATAFGLHKNAYMIKWNIYFYSILPKILGCNAVSGKKKESILLRAIKYGPVALFLLPISPQCANLQKIVTVVECGGGRLENGAQFPSCFFKEEIK